MLNLNQEPEKPARYHFVCDDGDLWASFRTIAIEERTTVKALLTHVIREFVIAYRTPK